MLASARASSRRFAALIILTGLFRFGAALSSDGVPSAGIQPWTAEVPDWLFPLNPPALGDAAGYDRVKPLHVPHSDATFTESQLNNLFAAPDWHPKSHSPVPEMSPTGVPPRSTRAGSVIRPVDRDVRKMPRLQDCRRPISCRTRHVRVLERARAPRAHVVGWVYAAIPAAATSRSGRVS